MVIPSIKPTGPNSFYFGYRADVQLYSNCTSKQLVQLLGDSATDTMMLEPLARSETNPGKSVSEKATSNLPLGDGQFEAQLVCLYIDVLDETATVSECYQRRYHAHYTVCTASTCSSIVEDKRTLNQTDVSQIDLFLFHIMHDRTPRSSRIRVSTRVPPRSAARRRRWP